MPLIINTILPPAATPQAPQASAIDGQIEPAAGQPLNQARFGGNGPGNGGVGSDAGLSFRAALDPALVGSIAQTPPLQGTSRPEKRPDASPVELSGTESAGLLGAAQVARVTGGAAPRAYQAATQRYAQAFFADTRTFARPGDAVELKA